jgi:hypothetical protein
MMKKLQYQWLLRLRPQIKRLKFLVIPMGLKKYPDKLLLKLIVRILLVLLQLFVEDESGKKPSVFHSADYLNFVLVGSLKLS